MKLKEKWGQPKSQARRLRHGNLVFRQYKQQLPSDMLPSKGKHRHQNPLSQQYSCQPPWESWGDRCWIRVILTMTGQHPQRESSYVSKPSSHQQQKHPDLAAVVSVWSCSLCWLFCWLWFVPFSCGGRLLCVTKTLPKWTQSSWEMRWRQKCLGSTLRWLSSQTALIVTLTRCVLETTVVMTSRASILLLHCLSTAGLGWGRTLSATLSPVCFQQRLWRNSWFPTTSPTHTWTSCTRAKWRHGWCPMSPNSPSISSSLTKWTKHHRVWSEESKMPLQN